MRRRFLTLPALAICGLLAVSGCTGGASQAPSVAPTATSAPASDAPASVAPTALPGTKEFSVGLGSPGLGEAPMLAALDALRSQGYKIETPQLASSELVAEGTAGGRFAFGSGADNSAMTAIAQGAKIKFVITRVSNEWTLYARTATIKSCADLAGKKLAIHGEGAVSTAMVRNYLTENCAGTEPQYVVIPGSPNRLAALLSNQIDASPLELSDAIAIDTQAGDRFSLLASLARDLPNLQTTSLYVNSDFAAANPGTVLAVVKAMLEEYRRIDGSAAALQADAEKHTPDAIDPKTIAASAAKYTELKMFPVNGGLTKENLEYSAKFFGPDGTGSVPKHLTIDQYADLSFLEMALEELGRK